MAAFFAIYPPVGGSILPPGSATAANQVIQIGLETSIDANTASIDSKTPALGQATMANSVPVVIASDQSIIPVHDAAFSDKTAAAFVAEPFDEIDITYVGATTDIDTVTYKLAGSTVATLTLGYDGSNRLTSVVRS